MKALSILAGATRLEEKKMDQPGRISAARTPPTQSEPAASKQTELHAVCELERVRLASLA